MWYGGGEYDVVVCDCVSVDSDGNVRCGDYDDGGGRYHVCWYASVCDDGVVPVV